LDYTASMLNYDIATTNTKCLVVKLLTQHNITPTQQRVKIGMVLLTKRQHLSADQILVRVNFEASVVSKATVYNTLGLFVTKGLIREVIVDSAKVFYDSNTQPHHHFYNVDTGELSDIGTSDLLINQLPALIVVAIVGNALVWGDCIGAALIAICLLKIPNPSNKRNAWATAKTIYRDRDVNMNETPYLILLWKDLLVVPWPASPTCHIGLRKTYYHILLIGCVKLRPYRGQR